MTLTEEQREAIRVISKLPMAIGCQLCHPYIMKNYGSHFIVLRAMIDSSGTVEPTGGFDLERARGLRDFLQDDCAEVGDVWGEMIAEIERLRADLEQSEEIKRLKDELENYGDHYACLLISKDAQIKELEGMLSIRTEELDIAHSVARSEKEMHEKELAAFARRIKELEDAHKRSGAKYAKIIRELRSSVYANIPGLKKQWDEVLAEGKIGNGDHIVETDQMIQNGKVWQITEERKAALAAMSNLSETISCPDCGVWIGFADIGPHMAVLRGMLEESQ